MLAILLWLFTQATDYITTLLMVKALLLVSLPGRRTARLMWQEPPSSFKAEKRAASAPRLSLTWHR